MAFSEHVAAGGRGEERARRAGDLPVCVRDGRNEMTRPVAHLGCTRESAYDLGCF